jgi:hypothetical protein
MVLIHAIYYCYCIESHIYCKTNSLFFTVFTFYYSIIVLVISSKVNDLLRAVGIATKKIASMKELTRVASSMFVAVFEAMFHVRLDGIIRSPHSKEDYEVNVQHVIDGLGQQIALDLDYLSGKDIVDGDFRALSNLINIFVHFAPKDEKAVGGGVVGVAAAAAIAIADRDGGAGSDENSISTKESTFDERPQSAGPGGRTSSAENQMFAMPADQVQKKCIEDARQLLLSTEAQIYQSERQEAARRRRDDFNNRVEQRLQAENKRKMLVSRKMQQRKWDEEAQREEEAHAQRSASEEHIMLRRIFSGLLNKLHTWRRSERQEAREKVCRMRDEAKSHIEALQKLFEDRVTLLREKTAETRKDEATHARSHRRMSTDLLRSYNGRKKRELESHKSLLTQKRQDQLLKRSESHRNLLALLSVETWQENLRSGNLSSTMPVNIGDLQRHDFVF